MRIRTSKRGLTFSFQENETFFGYVKFLVGNHNIATGIQKC